MKQNFKLYLILALTLILRFINLNQSLWLDEAIQTEAVLGNSLKSLFLNYFPSDFNPPLSYLISFVTVRFFGNSEIILRLPSVIFGVLNVWLIYHFSRRLLFSSAKNSSLASHFSLLTSLFLATAPLHIYYSQEGRPYILACLLATWSMYEFWKILSQENKIYWRYILSTSLMLYSHYMTWLLLPTQALAFFFYHFRVVKSLRVCGPDHLLEGDDKKKLFISWLTISLLLLPWVPTFLKQLKAGENIAQSLPVWSSLGAFSFKNLALIPVKFLIGRISIDNNLVYGLIMLAVILLTGWLLVRTLRQVERKEQSLTAYRLPLTALWFWLGVPIILGILLSFKMPLLQYFRFLFILPAFYILLAYGIYCHPEPEPVEGEGSSLPAGKAGANARKILIILFLTLNLTCSAIYLFNPKFHRENWKGLVEFISQKEENISIIILRSVSTPFKFYDKEKHKVIDYQEIEKAHFLPRVWFVKYAQPIFDPKDLTEKKLEKFGFEEVGEYNFRGIIIKYFINPAGLKA